MEQAVACISSVRRPADASRQLALLARLRRRARKMRADDITCMVIDINPHCAVNSDNCSSITTPVSHAVSKARADGREGSTTRGPKIRTESLIRDQHVHGCCTVS